MPIEEMSELVETGGAAPVVAVAPHAMPITHTNFLYLDMLAKRSGTKPAVILNEMIRKEREGRA